MQMLFCHHQQRVLIEIATFTRDSSIPAFTSCTDLCLVPVQLALFLLLCDYSLHAGVGRGMRSGRANRRRSVVLGADARGPLAAVTKMYTHM